MKHLKILGLLLPLFALNACGNLTREKVDMKKKTDAIRAANATASADPVLAQLAKDCQSRNGRLTPNGDICLLKDKTVVLQAPEAITAPEVIIDDAFITGKFIVATANATSNPAAVDILYNGRPFAKVPARLMADLKSLPAPGRLSFYVNATSYKDVTITVWSCFQRTISNRILCVDSFIP